MAARNPGQLNDASVTDAAATPPTMGTNVAITAAEGTSPKNSDDKSTLKNGYIALMVCVKETATFPRLTFVSTLPSVCTMASGAIALSDSIDSESLFSLCIPVICNNAMKATPAANCHSVDVSGNGYAPNTCLLQMLKTMLHAYQPAKRTPRMSVLTGTGDRSDVTAVAAVAAVAAAVGRRACARALVGKSGRVLSDMNAGVVVVSREIQHAGIQARALTMARAGDGTRPRGVARVDTSGASSAGDIFGLEAGRGVMLGTLCSATQNVRCCYPLQTFVMVHFTRGCRLHV